MRLCSSARRSGPSSRWYQRYQALPLQVPSSAGRILPMLMNTTFIRTMSRFTIANLPRMEVAALSEQLLALKAPDNSIAVVDVRDGGTHLPSLLNTLSFRNLQLTSSPSQIILVATSKVPNGSRPINSTPNCRPCSVSSKIPRRSSFTAPFPNSGAPAPLCSISVHVKPSMDLRPLPHLGKSPAKVKERPAARKARATPRRRRPWRRRYAC